MAQKVPAPKGEGVTIVSRQGCETVLDVEQLGPRVFVAFYYSCMDMTAAGDPAVKARLSTQERDQLLARMESMGLVDGHAPRSIATLGDVPVEILGSA